MCDQYIEVMSVEYKLPETGFATVGRHFGYLSYSGHPLELGFGYSDSLRKSSVLRLWTFILFCVNLIVFVPGLQAESADVVPSVSDSYSSSYFYFPSFGSYVEVMGGSDLDPQSSKTFLVGTVVSLNQSPDVGVRHVFMSKYQAQKKPHPGWVIGVKRYSTSMRPEVYWRGSDGSGGWYSFDKLEFIPGHWYSLFVISKPGDYLSLWGGEVFDRSGQGHSDIRFLGGYKLNGVVCPATDVPLFIGPRNVGAKDFGGAVSDLIVANLSTFPNKPSEIQEFLANSLRAGIIQTAPLDELDLLIFSTPLDRSPRNKTLKLRGDAKWQSAG